MRRVLDRIRRRSPLWLAFAAAVGGCDLGDDPESERAGAEPRNGSPAASRAAEPSVPLVDRLRRGGYVLAMRHAATESATDAGGDLRDCSRQRNLSAEGRRQARAIASAFARLRIPVGSVLASPYCRTRDTARLAFGRVRSSTTLLYAGDRAHGSAGARQPARLRRLLAKPPRRGANTVLVSHGFAIDDATKIHLEEGEALVVAATPGRRGFKIVARVSAGDWTRIARRAGTPPRVTLREYRVPAGSGPHDVAPARDGSVWYTGQATGELGRLDPRTGRSRRVALGAGSAPHGVIVGPDGAAWVTDGGLNAIVRVDHRTLRVRRFPLPRTRANANLNTATFDRRGRLWFTGQAGIYGRLDIATGRMRVFDAPGGPGAYGIATTPRGGVWYASLAGSHVARIAIGSGRARIVEPPTDGQGARRIWSDSRGRLWVSEWNSGKLGMYDPAGRHWREWALPGDNPQPYAVYVDEADLVWVTDFGANALVRFDPATERFQTFRLRSPGASVRQLLGRRGELWGAESGADRLVVARWR